MESFHCSNRQGRLNFRTRLRTCSIFCSCGCGLRLRARQTVGAGAGRTPAGGLRRAACVCREAYALPVCTFVCARFIFRLLVCACPRLPTRTLFRTMSRVPKASECTCFRECKPLYSYPQKNLFTFHVSEKPQSLLCAGAEPKANNRSSRNAEPE